MLSASKHPEVDLGIFATVGSLLFDDPNTNQQGRTLALVYHRAIVADAASRGEPRVVMVDFGQQTGVLGSGCQFHPNVTEQTRLATQLEAAIRDNLGW